MHVWTGSINRSGLTALAIVLTAWLGHVVAIPPGNITTVWFPTGIAFAALLVWGYRALPGVWLGSFIAHAGALISGEASGSVLFLLLSAAIIACVIVFQDVLGVHLIVRYTHSRDPFGNPGYVFVFVVVVTLVTCIVPAFGSTYMQLTGLIEPSGSLYALWSWYLGSLSGVIVTTPFIVIWARPFSVKPGKFRAVELLLFFILFYLVNLLVFSRTFQVGSIFFTLKYLLIPFILWAAFRFGQRGVVSFTVLMTGFALSTILSQLRLLEPYLINEALWFWQLFICVSSVTGLLLSAALRQRQEAEEGLKQLTVSLEHLVLERTAQLESTNQRLIAELETRERRTAELDAALASVADGLIVYAADARILRMNNRIQSMLGYTSEDMQKAPCERIGQVIKLFKPDGQPFPLEETPVMRALRGETVTGVELTAKTPEKTLWLSASAAPIMIAGSIRGAVLTLADITRLKDTEQALSDLNRTLEKRVRERTAELEASNRELESFSYTVAHDLRSPLRAISGFSRIVREEARDKLGEEELDYLERINNAAIRLSTLINDLLELARVTSVIIVPKRVDLSALARSIASELREQQPDRKAEFIIQDELYASGDHALLRTVLSNLMDNAWKYSSVREVTRIEVGALYREGKTIFYVRDNGIGFDMQYANKLFVPFHRLHSIEEYSGTGIGLPIVHRILERHGGTIWAESQPGHGATFYFVIPS